MLKTIYKLLKLFFWQFINLRIHQNTKEHKGIFLITNFLKLHELHELFNRKVRGERKGIQRKEILRDSLRLLCALCGKNLVFFV
jgi:hypothetical protein